LIGTCAAAAVQGRPTSMPARRRAVQITAALTILLLLSRLGHDLLLLREGPPDVWDDSILAASGAWLHGQPLYPKPEDGLFYGLLYGPLIYEILALSQKVFGIGSPLAALPGMLAELLAIAVTWRTSRRLGVAAVPSLLSAAVMFAWLCRYYEYNGMRGDPFLLLLAACALATLPGLERRSGMAYFRLGLCAGLAVAIKFTAVVYAMPALLCVFLRPDDRPVVMLIPVALGGLVGLGLPYLAPGAGPSDHWALLTELHPFALHIDMLIGNVLFVAALLLPPLLYRPGLSRGLEVRLLVASSLSLMPILFVAAVDGAGVRHFLPFLPAITLVLGHAVATGSALDRRGLAFLGMLWLGLLSGVKLQEGYIRQLIAQAPQHHAIRQALQAFLAAHAQARVAIGPSQGDSTDPLVRQTAWVVGTGQMLSFTMEAWLDMRSPEHAERFAARQLVPCAEDYWLTPPDAPFAGPLIGDRIQAAFHERYVLASQDRFFDVWACRKVGNG
jgi:4-amino-4-deoxy-L-arabinose transferase-like glycosyltransferase